MAFPKPPDVNEYIPRPVVYKRYSTFKRGDGSNSFGGIPPALAAQLTDPNPDIPPGWMTTGHNFGNTSGYNAAPVNGGTASEAKFRTNANFSHFSRDDPIRNYGQPDASHWHMFFGNRNTNAWSTYNTLRMNPSSNAAGGILNGTAYWIPAFLKTINGVIHAKPPNNVTIYYTLNPISQALLNTQVLLPRGLRYIAGCNMDDPDDLEAHAEIDASNLNGNLGYAYNGFVGYQFTNANGQVYTTEGNKFSRYFVNTDGSDPWGGANNLPGKMIVEINAPKYWDGYNLWSPGGYKHFRYGAVDKPDQNRTFGPEGWWQVPELQLQIEFNHGGWENDLRYWSLSSDPMASMKTQRGFPFRPGEAMHMDWIGAWNAVIFETWQRNGLGVGGFEPHEMGDSIISATQKLLVGGEAPDGRFPQVQLSNEYLSDPTGMVPLPNGSGRGPLIINHRGD